MHTRLDAFTRTFTTFHLFREPCLLSKLSGIAIDVQLNALLAAILTFGCEAVDSSQGDDVGSSTQAAIVQSSAYFSALGVQYVNEAISHCGDDSPPIVVLQAAILVTDRLLIQGVRGRAWRSLGLCIRIAHEMGLHSIDANVGLDTGKLDSEKWCQDEERRRASWAIWEMDIFASVLYRVPCTIDWSYTQVFLPAEDDKWLRGQPQKSCLLQRGLISRCKDLQKSGNESPKAWFIVLHSLMAEAHIVSCRGNFTKSAQDPKIDMLGGEGHPNDNYVFLETLLNSIQLCAMSLPSRWKYRGQFLDFDAPPHDGNNQRPSTIQRNSSIHEIAVMQEVARLMTLKNYIFEGGAKGLLRVVEEVGRTGARAHVATNLRSSSIDQKLDKYFHASDAILDILVNSSDAHVRYINPFIAHAAWMAAAVQMLRLELTRGEAQRELTRSKLEILRTTHSQFVEYWSMSHVPQQNLDTLAVQLKRLIRLPTTPPEGTHLSSIAATPTRPGAHLSRSEKHFQQDGNIARSMESEGRNGAQHAKNPALHPSIAEPESSTSASYNDGAGTTSLVNKDLRGWGQQPINEALQTPEDTTTQGLLVRTADSDSLDLASTLGMDITYSSVLPRDHGQAFPISTTPLNLTVAASAPSDIYTQHLDMDSLNWFGYPTNEALMGRNISNYLDEIFSGAYPS